MLKYGTDHCQWDVQRLNQDPPVSVITQSPQPSTCCGSLPLGQQLAAAPPSYRSRICQQYLPQGLCRHHDVVNPSPFTMHGLHVTHGSDASHSSLCCSSPSDAETEQRGHCAQHWPAHGSTAVPVTSPPRPGVRLRGLQPMPLGSSALRHHQLPAGAYIPFYRYLEGSGPAPPLCSLFGHEKRSLWDVKSAPTVAVRHEDCEHAMMFDLQVRPTLCIVVHSVRPCLPFHPARRLTASHPSCLIQLMIATCWWAQLAGPDTCSIAVL